MLVHPNIDPVAFSIGPLAVRWYGLMYLAGFAAAWWLGLQRIKKGLAAFTEQIAQTIGVSERHPLAAPPREKAIVASTTSL